MDDRTALKDPVRPQLITIDPIMPATMAARAEEAGVKRAGMDALTVFVLSVLGGAFIAMGAIFATTVNAGAGAMPYGVAKLLMGLTFSLGLMLVVIGGAELFTSNNMIAMAWASHKVRTRDLLFNWVVVFAGNGVGAVLTAALMFFTTHYTFGHGSIGLAALSIANGKAALTFVPALTLGIMCNALVCLASWMCYGARTTIDRVATLLLPIAAFVAAGFEHSIANLYFIPMALFIKAGAPASFWADIGKTAADFPALTFGNFLTNLVPVTIGNIIGGSVMVAAVYWFIYLRKRAV